jgi:hypothetical protein
LQEEKWLPVARSVGFTGGNQKESRQKKTFQESNSRHDGSAAAGSTG